MNNNEVKYAVFQPKETILESWCKDIVTLLIMTFLIGFSIWGDSVFWTFVTGGMALMWVLAKLKSVVNQSTKFRSKAELQKWVDSIENKD